MALVSVLIPAYERPDYVTHAINSVLAQSFDDFEILIGDDSRSDAVKNAVALIDDRRIRYNKHQSPKGAMQNWHDLLMSSESAYVATLNDDDYWEPEFLQRLVPPLTDDDSIGMTFCDSWRINDQGERELGQTEHASQTTHRDALTAGLCDSSDDAMLRLIAVWNAPQPAYAAVLRRQVASQLEIPSDTNPCHDLWCSYAMWKSGGRFFFVPGRYTNYRVHPGNLTNEGFARAEDFIFERIVQENKGNSALSEVIDRWTTIRWHRATKYLRHRSTIPQAQHEFEQAAPRLNRHRRAFAILATRSTFFCRTAGAVKSVADRVSHPSA